MLDLDYSLFPERIQGQIRCAVEACVPECKRWCDCQHNSRSHLHLVIDRVVDDAITSAVCAAADVDGNDIDQWWCKGITYTKRCVGWPHEPQVTSHMPWESFVRTAADAIIDFHWGVDQRCPDAVQS